MNSTGNGMRSVPLTALVVDPRNDIVDGPFGSRLKASEYVDVGVPIVRLQNIDRNRFVDKNIKYVTATKAAEIARHHFVAGDILVSKLGDPLGEACIAPESFAYGILVADVVRVRPDNNKVDTVYLSYALNSEPVVRQFRAETKGTTRPRVNLKKIRDLNIPIVESLVEQKRIVAEIEKQFTRLEAGVGALKRVQANLKRYRAAVLKAACAGKLVPTEAKFENLSLGSLGKWCGGGTPSKSNPKFWNGGDIPWVSPKDMKTEVISDSQDHITKEAVAKSATNLLPANTVLLVTRSGILQHTLPVAVTTRSVSLNQDLKALQPAPEYDSRYLALSLRAYEQDILHQCTKTGTTVQSIEFPVFLRYEIPVPPLGEQKSVVLEVERRLSVVEELEALVSANLQRATRLRQSILQKAFEGEL